MLDGALSVADAAKRLRVDRSRIRQLLSNSSLYGIKLRGEWRLPAFQFSKRGTVPGVQHVLRELPDDLHPVEVLEWFSNPDPDLEVGETSVSPLDWLRSGGDPERVSAVARDL
jgi:excisionase family DNA binding protein